MSLEQLLNLFIYSTFDERFLYNYLTVNHLYVPIDRVDFVDAYFVLLCIYTPGLCWSRRHYSWVTFISLISVYDRIGICFKILTSNGSKLLKARMGRGSYIRVLPCALPGVNAWLINSFTLLVVVSLKWYSSNSNQFFFMNYKFV